MRRSTASLHIAACAVAALCASGAARGARDAETLDPVGVWYCLVYGHLRADDWYASLRLEPEGRASTAWGLAVGNRGWRRLSNWSVDDDVLSFSDPDTGRRYEGDLSRSTLGGTWRAGARSGGWWCTRRSAKVAAPSARLTTSDAAMAVPLVAQYVQAPDYPREAIRQAKEGRAVACFLVDRNGFVVEPEIVELSDEAFREPTMQALTKSRFKSSDEPVALRPGCRSYLYRLDAVR